MQEKTLKEKIFEIVNLVPAGKVIYYGQVAELVGASAQVVGWILSGMKEEEYDKTPWHRVVAKTGYISTLKLGYKGMLQIQLLRNEEVEIKEDFIDMKKFGFFF